jgi:hypothetical protein
LSKTGATPNLQRQRTLSSHEPPLNAPTNSNMEIRGDMSMSQNNQNASSLPPVATFHDVQIPEPQSKQISLEALPR